MPRQPRPVDPSAGPVERFASDLRKLRDDAGTPTYRVLAEQTHFSKATLAAAAGGHRLPTLDVTLAFVRACGGDIEEWRARWNDTRRELGYADEKTPDPLTVQAAIGHPSQLRLAWILAVVGILIGITFVAATLIMTRGKHSSTGSAPTKSTPEELSSARFVPTGELSAQAVADGADPKRTMCASDPDVKTLDSVEINTDDEIFLGVAELRLAPRCNVAWGRFMPAENNIRLAGAIITIIAQRQMDSPAATSYQVEFDGQAVFGNILLMRDGCIEATVQVATPLSGQARSTTSCLTGGE